MTDKDYEVGYGKPPTHSHFKPGQSGYPAGRAKGSKNFKTDFKEELETKIEINEGGQQQEVTKQRAIIKRMINKALNGDPKAADLVTKLILGFTNAEESASENRLSAEESEMLDTYIKNQRGDDDAPTS